MSLILEALRRSEAERRRGQAPDLLSDVAPSVAATRRTSPNWNILAPLMGAALLAALLVAWWLRSSAEPVSAQPSSADMAANNAEAETDVVAGPLSAPAASHRQASLSPPARTSVASVPEPTPAPLSPPPRTQPTPAPATTVSAPKETQTGARRMAGEPAPTPLPPANVASIAPAAHVSAPAPVSAPAFASPEVPLKLADLSTDERQRLPALKVSMHMWAPDAGNRFAIIDGTRVNEGDRVGEATIEAIQQDGVMLSWHGRQIRLPIR